jgi:hypothetical protein
MAFRILSRLMRGLTRLEGQDARDESSRFGCSGLRVHRNQKLTS